MTKLISLTEVAQALFIIIFATLTFLLFLKIFISYLQRKTHKPKVVYVSTKGKNTNDGLSPERAWRSVAYAATRIKPGDTVYLIRKEGYFETVDVSLKGYRSKKKLVN